MTTPARLPANWTNIAKDALPYALKLWELIEGSDSPKRTLKAAVEAAEQDLRLNERGARETARARINKHKAKKR